MFIIQDISRFEKDLMNSMRGFFTYVQNPTKGELERGNYKPRLTLTNRFNVSGRSEKTLTIEFSAPKLLFGNNFDEITDDQFPQIMTLLQSKLKGMGILVFEKILVKSPVSAVHFSKNIPLTDGSVPYTYLKELQKVNLNQRMDLSSTDFRVGHGIKYHANTFEIAFYDKLKDLEQAKMSEKRAFEDDNSMQLNLFERFVTRRQFEVIRMEVRLNNRQKIKALFKKMGLEVELDFQSVFNKELSQTILLHYLDDIEKHFPPVLSQQIKSPEDFFADFVVSNPRKSLKSGLAMLGLKIITDRIGIRGFRAMTKRDNDNQWYKLFAETKPIKVSPYTPPFFAIRKEVEKFKPLRVSSLQIKN